jgi:hypothetical protein
MTAEQFYENLCATAQDYDGVDVLPDYPPLPRINYAHPPFRAEAGGLLDQLLAKFSPATEADRSLILAMILTLFWGGPPGKRPVFPITGPSSDRFERHQLAATPELASPFVRGTDPCPIAPG